MGGPTWGVLAGGWGGDGGAPTDVSPYPLTVTGRDVDEGAPKTDESESLSGLLLFFLSNEQNIK